MTMNNPFSLENKTALITGSASGLGYAMAKCMIACGAKVIIADLNGEAAKTLPSRWGQMHPGASSMWPTLTRRKVG